MIRLVEIGESKAILEKVEVIEPATVVSIPAFNEEKTIARVVLEAQKYADNVVVCHDGSSNMTAEIAERLGADVARHEQNLGYRAAIQSLFRRARELGADVLVTLDEDGQHDSREVPNVVKPVLEGKVNVVIGSRFVDERSTYTMPWDRRAGVKFITRLVNNSGKHDVRDAQSGFRAYNCKSLEKLTLLENGMGVSVEILVNARKQGLRVQEVSAACNYSKDVKTSTHNPIRHGVNVVMSIVRLVVEERPLLFLGVPGVFSLLVGVLFGVWMLQIYAVERQIVTNIALASMAFIVIGLFAIFTSITLYAITRVLQKTNRK